MTALEHFTKLRVSLAQQLPVADMEQLNLYMRNLEFDKAAELVAHLNASCES
jgi:hypothetical protein